MTEYYKAAGLLEPLEQLGFGVVGYGCTTCIGNSGPLDAEVAGAIEGNDLVVAAVLSGNRNFEGRIHPLARASYLASPPLVVAFALAGTVEIDLSTEPLGTGQRRQAGLPGRHLADPRGDPRHHRRRRRPDIFRRIYATVFDGDDRWRGLPVPVGSSRYAWDDDSTYVARPPFLDGIGPSPRRSRDIEGARALAVLGDSVTTDHISPAGSIPPESPAGQWLQEHGVAPLDFNSYGARRGHHEVMMRGTFGNIRLRNALAEKEGPYTAHQPTATRCSSTTRRCATRARACRSIVLAGREYGSGSSRDWAAKGPRCSASGPCSPRRYERIHRSNLVGMGILPLQFKPGQNAASLGLTGREEFDVVGLAAGLRRARRSTLAPGRDGPSGRSRHRPARWPGRARLLPPGRHHAGRAAAAGVLP